MIEVVSNRILGVFRWEWKVLMLLIVVINLLPLGVIRVQTVLCLLDITFPKFFGRGC